MNLKLMLKLVVIGLVGGVILIALAMVNGIIGERQRYRDDAVASIEASYSGPQTLIGPVLVRPYTETMVTTEENDKGVRRSVTHVEQLNAISFPRTLDVRGTMLPNERRHGLYRVSVYEFAASIAGVMNVVQPETKGTVVWGEPYLAMSVQDVRGIVGTPKVSIGGTPETMLQGASGMTGWQPNLRIPIRGAQQLSGGLAFRIEMTLAGTEQLSIAPVGDSNHVELLSSWPSPLFAGQFLPRTRSVGSAGFRAVWDVSSLATGTQIQMQSSGKPIDALNVTLLTPIDPY